MAKGVARGGVARSRLMRPSRELSCPGNYQRTVLLVPPGTVFLALSLFIARLVIVFLPHIRATSREFLPSPEGSVIRFLAGVTRA